MDLSNFLFQLTGSLSDNFILYQRGDQDGVSYEDYKDIQFPATAFH